MVVVVPGRKKGFIYIYMIEVLWGKIKIKKKEGGGGGNQREGKEREGKETQMFEKNENSL